MEEVLRPLWMKDAVIVVTTLSIFALIAFIYVKLQPIVMIPPESIIAQCPSRWVYMVEQKMCQPQYPTKCKPFDPDNYSEKEKCDIARTCGTYWKGLCDFM